MSSVYFHYHHYTLSLTNKKAIRSFINNIFLHEKKRLGRLDYIFCGDNYLLEINKKYLKHNYYTDTITFNLSENSNIIKGEIYISIERIKENAEKYNSTFKEEALRVIFHGALHLCGYRDKNNAEIKAMRSAEKKYLLLFKNMIK